MTDTTQLAKGIERFRSRIAGMPVDECWPYRTGQRCHLTVTIGGRKIGAHRLAYQIFVGPIPEGMQVCHTCDNPPCVNPAHLFLGTVRDNALDRTAKGRGYNQDKDSCPSGHPYSADNTYVSGGKRYCLTCNRKSCRDAYYKRKAATA